MSQFPEPSFPPISGETNASSRPPRAPGMATAALVCGILGFCGVTSVVGLVLGIMGLKQAKVVGAGSARAVTAIVLSSLWLLLTVAIVISGAVGGSASSSLPVAPTPSTASTPSFDPSPLAMGDTPQSAPAPEDPPTLDAIPNLPDTTLAGNSDVDGISYEWVDKPKCGYFDCFQMRVSADTTECLDGLYVEVNLLDQEDTIVGYSNDTVGSLREGQRAILTFDVTEDNVESADVSKFSCH